MTSRRVFFVAADLAVMFLQAAKFLAVSKPLETPQHKEHTHTRTLYRQIYGWMDGWIDRQTDRYIDGRVSPNVNFTSEK